jgi:serine/threonine protein kinase
MALRSGTHLGPYEILEPLGAGGMGEVYRARDTRLGREVAVKVLPSQHSSDPRRLRRFEDEARAVAALDHPHILSVHDVGVADDAPYVVFELLEGRSLRQVLERGPLPPRKVVDYAVQICRGLEVAHARGIVHRDLKPANLFLTADGRVKILDFGLAKLQEPVEGAGSQGPTRPTETKPNAVLGTVGYMSPEQARGQPAGARSDLFSLGTVLFEMLSGRSPFLRDTAADTLSAILHHDPPAITTVPDPVPAGLERVVRRCLEKDPRDRFRSAMDVAFALDALSTSAGDGMAAPVEAPGRRRRRPWPWVAASVVVIAGAFAWWWLSQRRPEAPAAPLKITPFTSDGGYKSGPRLSPDGQKVAYVWGAPENEDIYVKALTPGSRPLRLTEDPASDTNPAWSPDGQRLAFVRQTEDGTALYTVPSLGGQETRRVALNSVGPLSWAPSGDWIAAQDAEVEDGPTRIVRLDLETFEKRPLTTPAEALADFQPALSPDGDWLALVRANPGDAFMAHVWVQAADGGSARRLTTEASDLGVYGLAWTADSQAIVFSGGRAGARHLHRVGLEGTAPPALLGVGRNAIAPSIWGRLLVYVDRQPHVWDFWRAPGRKATSRDRIPEKLATSTGHDLTPRYSPDGTRLAFQSTRSGTMQVWVCDADGTNPVQLTNTELYSGNPAWSPDSRRLVFTSGEAGDWNLYVIDADGGVPRQLTHEPSDDSFGSWSRDGRWIYFHSDRGGPVHIWKMPAEGGEPLLVARTLGGQQSRESWDGEQLYFTQKPEQLETTFGVTPQRLMHVPTDGGAETEVVPPPVVGFDVVQSGLYYMTVQMAGRSRVYQILYRDFASGEEDVVLRTETSADLQDIDVSPAEDWIAWEQRPASESELVLVENFR